MASLFELLGKVNWSDLEGRNARESGVFEYSTSKIEVIMMTRELNKRLKVSRLPSCTLLMLSLRQSYLSRCKAMLFTRLLRGPQITEHQLHMLK